MKKIVVLVLAMIVSVDFCSGARTRPWSAAVLVFHRVEKNPPRQNRPDLRRLTLEPAEFESVLGNFLRRGWHFVPLRDVLSARFGGRLPGRSAAVTLDDGYDDNYSEAWPILRRLNIPATIFVVPATIGTPRHLTWTQIEEMRAGAVDFSAHTWDHRALADLHPLLVDLEIWASRAVIESRLHVTLRDMAYPYGLCDDVAARRVEAAGYEAAWMMGDGMVTARSDAYRLPRFEVRGGEPLQTLFDRINASALRATSRRSSASPADRR